MNRNANLQDISINSNYHNKPLWFILYTYPRAEKVVYKELIKRDIESFLPCIKLENVWKNRQKKLIEKVLFPGYIFVKTSESLLYNIIRLPKIVSFVGCDNKPSIIKQIEIDCIKKMLNESLDITTEYISVINGNKVKIVSGPFADYEGIVLLRKGKTLFGIELTGINQIIFVDITSNKLQMINQNE
jgi:transcription antitermination factor NusG